MGHATRASARLYPHQWSWDSACIAIGYSRWDQARAQAELRGLFAGQWADGLLPHIRFAPDARYFPGPEFWQTHLSPLAPRDPQTSGIVQPPVHATAVWKVFRHARDGEDAKALPPRAPAEARRMARVPLPRADPWATTGSSRSGTRGSRAWTTRRSGTTPSRGSPRRPTRSRRTSASTSSSSTRTSVRRTTTTTATRTSSSSTATANYDPERIRDDCPFVVRDVLFNSLLVQANRDLAEISRVVGADPEPFEAWADRTAAGLERASGTRPRRRTSTSTSARATHIRGAHGRRRSRRSMPGSRAATASARLVERARTAARSRSTAPAGSSRASLPTTRASIPRGTGAGRSGP